MSLNATQRTQLLDLISSCNSDDLKDASTMMKARWNALATMSVMKFRVGDKVQFDSAKRGTVSGKIMKVNRKTVKVRADDMVMWTVSPGLLKAQERV